MTVDSSHVMVNIVRDVLYEFAPVFWYVRSLVYCGVSVIGLEIPWTMSKSQVGGESRLKSARQNCGATGQPAPPAGGQGLRVVLPTGL